MAVLARALVAGGHGNRHGSERRASAGGEDENVRRRRERPSLVDSFGTTGKSDAANLPGGFDLGGELGTRRYRARRGVGTGGCRALVRDREREKAGEQGEGKWARGGRVSDLACVPNHQAGASEWGTTAWRGRMAPAPMSPL